MSTTTKAAQPASRWIKPIKHPEKKCGCVYSLLGLYPLYFCPEHERISHATER